MRGLGTVVWGLAGGSGGAISAAGARHSSCMETTFDPGPSFQAVPFAPPGPGAQFGGGGDMSGLIVTFVILGILLSIVGFVVKLRYGMALMQPRQWGRQRGPFGQQDPFGQRGPFGQQGPLGPIGPLPPPVEPRDPMAPGDGPPGSFPS